MRHASSRAFYGDLMSSGFKVPRAAVTSGLKQILTLGCKFLEARIVSARIRGVQVHEELNCALSGLAVAIALKIAASLDPMYATKLESPGAMPRP